MPFSLNHKKHRQTKTHPNMHTQKHVHIRINTTRKRCMHTLFMKAEETGLDDQKNETQFDPETSKHFARA